MYCTEEDMWMFLGAIDLYEVKKLPRIIGYWSTKNLRKVQSIFLFTTYFYLGAVSVNILLPLIERVGRFPRKNTLVEKKA